MSILPLIPILILLIGALAVIGVWFARFRHPDIVASVVSLLALLSLIPLAVRQPIETLVSSWRPVSVFGAPASLRVEPLGWLVSLVAIAACASISWMGLAYPGRRRLASRALALGMTGALVASAYAANMLTLALAWGMFDALFAIGVLARGGGGGAGRRAAFAVGFNSAATVCLWVAALAAGQAHRSLYWHLSDLPDTARQLLALAAVLRLGLYPFNQWLPAIEEDTPGRPALLYILPPLAGLHVLIRLAQLNALPQASALAWLAALSMLVGGALAWLRGRSREALPYISVSTLGAVVLSALSGGLTATSAAVMANGAVTWALAMLTLNIGRGFDPKQPWWWPGYALALGALIGLPATTGFALRTNLAAGLVAGGDVLRILLAVAGETFTFGALIHLALAPLKIDAPSRWKTIVPYAAAIALVALPAYLLPAFGRSLIPELIPPSFSTVLPALGFLGVIIFVLPIALAAGLEWSLGDRPLQPRFDFARLMSLEWLYAFAFRLINAVAGWLRSVGALLEGDGAMLWALLILIALYVVLSGVIQ